ncbi:AAA family ATPase [Dehalococcoides mccartyi]|nr:AAA family ATPase [Dehalococcoides mccartyi]
MICQKCNTENPDQAKFCMGCGDALQNTCPECATELPSGAKFCFSCGAKIGVAAIAQTDDVPSNAGPTATSTDTADTKPTAVAESDALSRLAQYVPPELLSKLESARAGSSMAGERRVVTMLFCDIQGSTAAAGSLDPEDWAEIINGAFEHLIAPVYKYEGTLARLMGDAILAFFGAPIAHEDDPQRAVLAGLDILESVKPYAEEIKRKWGFDLAVRVGINTGLVVVGEVGSDLRVEYSALGDAINIAARMEQTAAPNTLQITAETQKLIAPFFDFTDLGGIEVKGKEEPVQAYQVNSANSKVGQLRGIEGLDSPLIGRSAEMNALNQAASELTEGRGQIVSVMGEAGLGKSRLMAELRQSVGTDKKAMWLEGRSLSYETETPYSPFIDIMTTLLHGAGLDTENFDYLQFKSIIQRLAPENGTTIAPHLASLAGITASGEDLEVVRYLDPPRAKAKTFEAAHNFFREIAANRSLILVFDDLHWVDPTSLELIKLLMPIADQCPLMLVGVYRPRRQERSWEFFEAASRDFAHRHVEVNLQPLDEEDARELVANLLEVDDLPINVRNLILEKAEGNPFFVEEVIRTLLDKGLVVRQDGHWHATQEINQIDVPDTLNGVLTARLDALEDSAKRVLQIAAVVGREFDDEQVASVVGDADVLNNALLELQRRELIREKSRQSHRMFIFKHAMTQESAYASVLRSDRREMHLSMGEFLETSRPEQIGDIARHFVSANEPDRALPYLVMAGSKSAKAYATDEAITIFQQACEIVEQRGAEADPTLARQVYEGLGGTLTFSNQVDEAVKTYEMMQETAVLLNAEEMRVSAMNKLGLLYGTRQGELQKAVETLEQSEQFAIFCGDVAGQAERHMTNCFIQTTLGDFDQAYESLKTAEKIGRETDDLEARLFGLTHIANTLMYMGRFTESYDMANEALELALETGHKVWEAELKAFTIAFYHLCNGDLKTAYKFAKEGGNIGARIGAGQGEAAGRFIQANIARMEGRFDKALEFAGQALAISQSAGLSYIEAATAALLGSIELDISPDRANATAQLNQLSLEALDKPLGTAMGAMVWAELGFSSMMTGNPEQAKEMFDNGLTISTATKILSKPQLLMGQGMLQMMDGDIEGALATIDEAQQFADSTRMLHYTPFFGLMRGMMHGAAGNPESALESLAESKSQAVSLGMLPTALQASLVATGIISSQDDDEAAKIAQGECENLIEQITASITDSQISEAFNTSAKAKLPA